MHCCKKQNNMELGLFCVFLFKRVAKVSHYIYIKVRGFSTEYIIHFTPFYNNKYKKIVKFKVKKKQWKKLV